MTTAWKSRGAPIVPLLAGAAAVALVAASPLAGKGGALLLALVFWAAVVEGCVAAAAAGTLVNARWVASVRGELLSVAPLLLVASLLLLLLVPFLDIYPWARAKGLWTTKDFFVGRNLAFLLLAYLTARRFAAAPEGNPEERRVRAATYLFVFVASQSLAAYDLVMFLEYPWYSTLFGGYFFIEATYGGFAVAALLCARRRDAPPPGGGAESRSALRDLAILMFGFSLLWAGLFFAQYLVIWYGNIPEEVSFIARRLQASPFRELSVAVLFLFFFVPFPVLLAARSKANPWIVSGIAFCVLSGILVERYLFVAPAVRMGAVALAVLFLCLLALFLAVLSRAGRGGPLESRAPEGS